MILPNQAKYHTAVKKNKIHNLSTLTMMLIRHKVMLKKKVANHIYNVTFILSAYIII